MKVKTLSILDSFTSQHFVNVATSCGIKLFPNEVSELEVISIVLAKERAQAMLAKVKARKERELQKEKNKNKLMLMQVE
jgi:hypothetical protein